jgi:hypothetical protein
MCEPFRIWASGGAGRVWRSRLLARRDDIAAGKSVGQESRDVADSIQFPISPRREERWRATYSRQRIGWPKKDVLGASSKARQGPPTIRDAHSPDQPSRSWTMEGRRGNDSTLISNHEDRHAGNCSCCQQVQYHHVAEHVLRRST